MNVAASLGGVILGGGGDQVEVREAEEILEKRVEVLVAFTVSLDE